MFDYLAVEGGPLRRLPAIFRIEFSQLDCFHTRLSMIKEQCWVLLLIGAPLLADEVVQIQ